MVFKSERQQKAVMAKLRSGNSFFKIPDIRKAVDDFKKKQALKREASIIKERDDIKRLQDEERARLEKEKLEMSRQSSIDKEKQELERLRAERKSLQAERFKSSGFGKAASAVGKVALSAAQAGGDYLFGDEPASKRSSKRASVKYRRKKPKGDSIWD